MLGWLLPSLRRIAIFLSLGGAMALVFQFYRASTRVFRWRSLALAVADLLFWLLAAAASLFCLRFLLDAGLRFYDLCFMLLGWMLYCSTLHKLFYPLMLRSLQLVKIIARYSARLIRKILYLFFYPWKRLGMLLLLGMKKIIPPTEPPPDV